MSAHIGGLPPTVQRQAVPVRHRPNIEEMTEAQVEALRDAFADMQEIRDDRGYAYFAGQHGLPLPKGCRIAHEWPAFLPWHRAYLYEFEQALRDNGRHDVMLPWWDWTKTPEVPAAYAAPTRPDGSPNPLFSVSISAEALAQGQQADPAREPETVRLAEIAATERETGRPGQVLDPTALGYDYALSFGQVRPCHGPLRLRPDSPLARGRRR